tara:strand:+ start:103 stop:1233 length:1131 start_codon:yes stop_codon:yes gene_type:complete
MDPREQAARSMMSAGIGSLSGNKYDGLDSQMTTSTAGNNFYIPNFNVVSGRTNQYDKTRNGNSSQFTYDNYDFVNPDTNQTFSNSSTNTPNNFSSRFIYPDGSGYGNENGKEYPIQLKGPQTYRFDPGKTDKTGRNYKGITNRNLGGAKVMNATNYLDPTADDYFLREFGQYMKRFLPGYDQESDEYRQKQYRDSILDEEENPIYDPDNPNHFMVPEDYKGYDPDSTPPSEKNPAYDPDNPNHFMVPDGMDPELFKPGIETLEAGMGDSYQSLEQQINELDPDNSNYDDMLEMLNNDMEMKYPYMMAELTDDQMNMMGNRLNTPDFGVSKEDLYNRTKDMEDKGFFGFGAQEPTTREEFEDYYRKLQLGTVGNWVT